MEIMTIRCLFHSYLLIPLYLVGIITMMGCGSTSSQASLDNPTESLDTPVIGPGVRALLASRFETLDDLKKVVELDYFNQSLESDTVMKAGAGVRLNYRAETGSLSSTLTTGVSQEDFIRSRDGGLWEKFNLILLTPYAVSNRYDLNKVYKLSRRRPAYFGEGDVAFFDLAETSVRNITTPRLAYQNERDSSEKGFLNTFNHVTAQAFMTTFFSEELADFVAVVHERHNMPELITGRFTEAQLVDPNNNPIDNYVDIVNNEVGQLLGNLLKEKYQINRETQWTPELLANYLNDLQRYYSWSFGIGFKPYRPSDEVVIRFAGKLQIANAGLPFKEEL